jgi:hypothetical protein
MTREKLTETIELLLYENVCKAAKTKGGKGKGVMYACIVDDFVGVMPIRAKIRVCLSMIRTWSSKTLRCTSKTHADKEVEGARVPGVLSCIRARDFYRDENKDSTVLAGR